jgi:hypothetical protein
MNRTHFLSALGIALAVCLVAAPASAQGLLRIHNSSFSQPVTVELRVGDTLDGATSYGTKALAQGQSWEVDTGGIYAFWRRELHPGSNDGQYTDWSRVNTSYSDETVNF